MSESHPVFVEADEHRHESNDNPLWQESTLLHWYDASQCVGGWHRIGHEPNANGGRAAIWSFLFDRDGGWQYRRCGDLALTPADHLARGFSAGSALRFEYSAGTAHWFIDDAGVKAHLACENLFPIVDPFPKSDVVAAKRFPNHFEVAGRVTGYIERNGHRIEVCGYGYRDHSWGPRDWSAGMPNHRWFTGTLEGKLSFAAITAQAPTGRISRVGYIHRYGRIEHATGVDVVVHMEPDGLTHRGGELSMRLASGELIRITFRARTGVLFQRGNVVMVEMFCEAHSGGLSGYLDAEISSNPRAGIGPVLLALNAATHEGIAPFAPLEFGV